MSALGTMFRGTVCDCDVMLQPLWKVILSVLFPQICQYHCQWYWLVCESWDRSDMLSHPSDPSVLEDNSRTIRYLQDKERANEIRDSVWSDQRD